MAERRYSFRFSLPEGCVLLLSFLLTSFLVFLFGVYVGKEVEAQKAVQQTRTVRLPLSASTEPSSPQPAAEVSAVAPPMPAEKPAVPPSSPNPATSSPAPGQRDSLASLGEAAISRGSLTVANQTASVGQRKPTSPPSSNSATSTSVTAKPLQSPPPSNPAASALVVPKLPPSSLANPMTSAAVAVKSPASLAPGSEPSSARTPSAEQGPAAKEKNTPTTSGRWTIQVQATTNEEAAQNTAKLLREQGFSPVVSKVERQGEVWYRIRVGKFSSEEEARGIVSRLRREGKFAQAYPVLE